MIESKSALRHAVRITDISHPWKSRESVAKKAAHGGRHLQVLLAGGRRPPSDFSEGPRILVGFDTNLAGWFGSQPKDKKVGSSAELFSSESK